METKAILTSKTFWGVVIALVGFILKWAGVEFPAEDQAALVDQIVGIMPELLALGGAVLAIIGRMRATKAVTLTGKPRVPPVDGSQSGA